MKITTNLFHKGEVMDFKSLYGQNVCEKTAKQRFDALKEKFIITIIVKQQLARVEVPRVVGGAAIVSVRVIGQLP